MKYKHFSVEEREKAAAGVPVNSQLRRLSILCGRGGSYFDHLWRHGRGAITLRVFAGIAKGTGYPLEWFLEKPDEFEEPRAIAL